MAILSKSREGAKEIIGVAHLLPLPGSPGWKGDLDLVVDHAQRDTEALARGGIDAVIFENFGDIPFLRGTVPSETVAAMAVVIESVANNVEVPFGVNVLATTP